MDVLTKGQRALLGSKLNRYLRASAKLMEAQAHRDFERKQVLNCIKHLPPLFFTTEEYKRIICEL